MLQGQSMGQRTLRRLAWSVREAYRGTCSSAVVCSGSDTHQYSNTTMKLKAWLRKSNSNELDSHLSMPMPPNEIYHDADFLRDENRPGGIFRNFWTYVGHTGQFAADGEGKFITATLGSNLPIIILQCQDMSYRGFVNVCRHRATILLQKSDAEDRGGCGFFGKNITCMYHGWQYSANGRLVKALKMKGVQDFSAKEHSLFPVQVEVLGNLVFARAPLDFPVTPSAESAQAASPDAAGANHFKATDTFDSMMPGLRERFGDLLQGTYQFISRHSYEINCNWKIFADNYLDGGYHIHTLHPGLASQLDLKTYTVELFQNYSIQHCEVPPDPVLAGREVRKRVGPPMYAWVFPTTAINKYGDWLDVHVVHPLGPDRCKVVFDYFLAGDRLQNMRAEEVKASIDASHDVQMEDIGICEMVQQGLASGGYRPGRYAASEAASFHFHETLSRHI